MPRTHRSTRPRRTMSFGTDVRPRGRRSRFGSVLRGLGALVVIVVVLAGIPLALTALAGNPLPDSVPSWGDVTSALTEPDDGSLFLQALLWIAWLGWISFAVGLLVEIPAALSGRKAPRLPALRFQQRAAAGLLAAVAAAFVVGPVGAATAAEPVQPPAPQRAPVTTAQAPAQAAPEVATTEAAPATEAATPAMAQRTHTVQRGESLWRIAEQELGDGMRWPEIAELNYGTPQPGGGSLDNTHWIAPGWQLRLPPEPATTAAPVADTGATTHVVAEGDTLWDIAEQRLGDGARYPELVDASRDTVQPDGRRLTDPDLIRPGWTITVPGTAGAPPVVADPISREPAQPPAEEPAAPPPAEEPAQPPAAEEPAQPPAAEAPAEEQPPAEAPVQPPAAQQPDDAELGDAATQAVGDDTVVPLRTAAGVGALMAAGVLGVLAVRRRTQQRRREPGERIAMPAGALAGTEQELRGVADPMSVELVDLALRGLAADCARRGVALPPLRIGRLTSEQFELYLTDTAQLPEPFVATEQGHVWLLPAAAVRALDAAELREVPAPYPSLVTVGHGPEDGHLLLDLERLGTLAVVGDHDRSREVMAALAVELATSPWADDLQVTLVGTCPELADGLDTGRIRHLPTVGSLLGELTTRARNDRVALAESGAYSLDDARARGVAVAAWTPEIVLLGTPLGPDQEEQLAELVESLPRVAVAAVTSGHGAVGQWSLELTDGDPDAAVLQPVGVEVQPQRLDRHQYAQILELLGITSQPAVRPWVDTSGHPVGEPDPGAVGPGLLEPLDTLEADFDRLAAPDAVDDRAATDDEVPEPEPAHHVVPGEGPTVLLLGPVEVEDAEGPVEQSKYRQLTEIAAFIALNPGRGHSALDDAMWPGSRVTQNTRNTAISKLRRWFGRDIHGDDYLPRVDSGYRFHPGVSTDWDQWRALVGDDPTLAGTPQLVAALELVRGQPFTGVNPRRYGWAEHLKQEMISAIVDAAHELAQRAIRGGDAHLARKASTIGLQVEPGMELLWRDRIRAEHLAGNRAGIDDAIARMTAISADLGDDLEDATVRLIAKLTSPAPQRSGIPERL
ncbi:LysM peptidoglycan-binding domain-containing protein [Jiangella ureilytica]|uniref:LysM peptidoglycan-binding domain-containing protein n=1 Tax=Jiangella ureilytica TaxID=2530374 RepID=A0A4R4RGC3_9ACTN|nr:LysM peptidoglycan-binding domain-containing protein [Jiangella ureilytica]TDC48306.1 LysM peptidoglycan-binding domain-containing protein [Jiangella ureilytica]